VAKIGEGEKKLVGRERRGTPSCFGSKKPAGSDPIERKCCTKGEKERGEERHAGQNFTIPETKDSSKNLG